MTYYGVRIVYVLDKEVQMSVQDAIFIILQTFVEVTVISSLHHRETTNAHWQCNKIISYVEESIMLQ